MAPPSDLPDNTAQDSYYWFVRPCKSFTRCSATPTRSRRTRRPPTPSASCRRDPARARPRTAPRSPPTRPSRWTDYSTPTRRLTYAGGDDPSYQTALAYHVQIAQLVDVHQHRGRRRPPSTSRSTRPSDRTLPQGTLYWRVQAVDPAGNNVNWSPVRSFSNDQPAISLAASGAVPSPVERRHGRRVHTVPVGADERRRRRTRSRSTERRRDALARQPGVRGHHPPVGVRVAELPAAVEQRLPLAGAVVRRRRPAAPVLGGRTVLRERLVGDADRARHRHAPAEQQPLLHLEPCAVRGELPPRRPRREQQQRRTAGHRRDRQRALGRSTTASTPGGSSRSTRAAARSRPARGAPSRSTPPRRS